MMPIHQARKAENEDNPADKVNPYVEFDGFGQLLKNLESSERAFEANSREAERQFSSGNGIQDSSGGSPIPSQSHPHARN